jgi:hypothetical protein
MENQGRRPDQVEENEKIAFWSFLFLIVMVAAIAVFG